MRMLASFALPVLLATCAPGACENPATNTTPTTTTTTVSPPVTVPPSGWRLCIDTDGAMVSEQVFKDLPLETFQTGATSVPEVELRRAIDDVRTRFAPWGVEVVWGECTHDNRTFHLYLSDAPAPIQTFRTVGTGGYAYVGGWGYRDVPGLDIGFVFAERLDWNRLGATLAHEAGHGAGLTHPNPVDYSIMSDAYWGYGWSAAQVTALGAKFFPDVAGITVSDRGRKHGAEYPYREELELSNGFRVDRRYGVM